MNGPEVITINKPTDYLLLLIITLIAFVLIEKKSGFLLIGNHSNRLKLDWNVYLPGNLNSWLAWCLQSLDENPFSLRNSKNSLWLNPAMLIKWLTIDELPTFKSEIKLMFF